ncbi:MAG: heavy metal translocating P-type ATPase [Anaerovoracaceae bacterium]|jgi:Cu2+-exporting ATPase
MEQYDVTGMSCAACQARVEKVVSQVPGVTDVAVSLLTNSMRVEGTADESEICKAVADAGYGASPRSAATENTAGASAKLAAEEAALEDKTTPQMVRRLIASVIFLLVLMYFSMGVHMWGWPVPPFMVGNHVSMGLMQMCFAIVIMIINRKFFVSGFKSLAHGAPNMDSLIAIGAGVSFAYSLVMLFYMTYLQSSRGSAAAMPVMNEFYFESAAMILTLITIGKTLESYSKGRTTDALKSLMKLAPKTANVVRGGEEMTVPIDDVRRDDIFVVRPGENIPVDGEVLEGTSAVNESALTGESIPVDKGPGSEVSSATLNQSGFLKCRATRVGEDTTLSQIIAMVSDAASTKAPVARLADTISGVFVPAMLAVAAAVIVIWLIISTGDIGLSLQRGISVLVVACPCALGLATPVAIMVGNGMGAKHGILFKTAEALQETGNVQIVALDKTGTITNGEPVVTDIIAAAGCDQDTLLQAAAALEEKSEHPLAAAVNAYAEENSIKAEEVSNFAALPGNGLSGESGGRTLRGGNARFMAAHVEIPQDVRDSAEKLAEEGKTPLFFAADDRLLGIIAVADTIKEDSAQAIRQLRGMGLHVVMITGDNRRTAEAIGRQAGVDEVAAGVMPEGKEAIIRQLQEKGKVAMIGDGINDAPALTRANIGIAIGAGTDVAIDAADVVLMKSRLTDAAAAIRLSRQTYRDILQNLFWALIYNVALIPLAAGAYSHFGLAMNPMWGAAAMSCSSVFVVCNALRLNLFDIFDPRHDRMTKHPAETGSDGRLLPGIAETDDGQQDKNAIENKENRSMATEKAKEENAMKETVNIKGMMCEHCEATVKKALEALDGVDSAEVSHVDGNAVLQLSSEVADADIKKAVEDKDYEFVSVVKG